MFMQHVIKLSAAVHALSCSQTIKKLSWNNAVIDTADSNETM